MPNISTTTQQETPKAAQAFADFVALGPTRSLRKLATLYAEQKVYKTSTAAMRSLSQWSVKYRWQSRVAEAATALSARMLGEAAELDANTFLETSRRLNVLIHAPGPIDPGNVTRIRESVRKPEPKGGASVKVSVSVEVRHMAEQMAKALGMDAEQLIRDAEEIAEAAWNKGAAT